MYAIRVAPSAHLINYERVSSVAGRTLAAIRRTIMSKKLIYLTSFVLVLSIAQNSTAD